MPRLEQPINAVGGRDIHSFDDNWVIEGRVQAGSLFMKDSQGNWRQVNLVSLANQQVLALSTSILST